MFDAQNLTCGRDTTHPMKKDVYTSCMTLSQALIDRPDEVRKVENFKRLQLTTFKLDIPKLAKKKALKAALESDGRNKLLSNIEATAQAVIPKYLQP